MKITYSLIIPVHNSEKTLEKTMESVLNQSHRFDEILLIENNSIDNGLGLCQYYEKTYTNIKLLISQIKGPSAARNLGIKKAQSEYLLFLDADDELNKDFLKKVHNAIILTDTKSDLYEFNFNHFFQNGTSKQNEYILKKGIYEGQEYLLKSLENFHEETKFMSWRFAYKKSFLQKQQILFDEELLLFEDIVFMWNIFKKNASIYVMCELPILNYLYHGNSLTNTTQDYYFKALQKAYQKIIVNSKEEERYFIEFATKILNFQNFKKFYLQINQHANLFVFYIYMKTKLLITYRKVKRKLSN